MSRSSTSRAVRTTKRLVRSSNASPSSFVSTPKSTWLRYPTPTRHAAYGSSARPACASTAVTSSRAPMVEAMGRSRAVSTAAITDLPASRRRRGFGMRWLTRD